MPCLFLTRRTQPFGCRAARKLPGVWANLRMNADENHCNCRAGMLAQSALRHFFYFVYTRQRIMLIACNSQTKSLG